MKQNKQKNKWELPFINSETTISKQGTNLIT